MIKKQLIHKITNRALENYTLTVKSSEDNQEWFTINHFETNIHLPIIVIPELIEALEEHYQITYKTGP